MPPSFVLPVLPCVAVGALIVSALAASPVAAQSGGHAAVAVTAPDGWSAKHQGEATVLTPTGLPAGREIAMEIGPEVTGDGEGNRSLLDAARAHPFSFLGRRTTTGKFSRIDAIPGGIGQIDGFVAPDGKERIVVYFVVPRGRARRGRSRRDGRDRQRVL